MGHSQSEEVVKALNSYVSFTNESIHGLLTVHRLLENSNQEVNKYVDLPGYQINNISNADLPQNIYLDTDHWFYQTTPYEWFEKIKSEKPKIGAKAYDKLFPLAQEIFNTNNNINQIRFTIADFIDHKDLKNKENLDSIYILLENAVDMIDLFYALEFNLSDALNSVYKELNTKPLQPNVWFDLYDASKEVLLAVRVGDNTRLQSANSNINSKLEKCRDIISKIDNIVIKSDLTKVLKKNEDIANLGITFISNPEVTKPYELYGADYYYYNVRIIEKFNRYGNGFVPILNEFIDKQKLNVLHKFEFPHFLRIIYPRRIEKVDPLITSNIKNIGNIPKELKGRKVNIDQSIVILADTAVIKLELFDHKIQDGDIVSINFNGDWIYENLSLETKPKSLLLNLNPIGKNYLVLHAVNVGTRPPNTIGIHYYYKGVKKTIILQSDMNTSQSVEIKME